MPPSTNNSRHTTLKDRPPSGPPRPAGESTDDREIPSRPQQTWFHAPASHCKGTFSHVTDNSTRRQASVVENLFASRRCAPVDSCWATVCAPARLTHLRSPFNYVVEALVVLLFAGACWTAASAFLCSPCRSSASTWLLPVTWVSLQCVISWVHCCLCCPWPWQCVQGLCAARVRLWVAALTGGGARPWYDLWNHGLFATHSLGKHTKTFGHEEQSPCHLQTQA
jgi:hypothetical protein